ncbi:hypothetical protein B0H13DRAFT_2498575 [Mycena leptocephala]|nr:hypothetical protein B0H13DRAFT_2498575 [Mycena leptocephala]
MPAASRLFGTTISYTRVVQCYSPALRPLSHSPLGLSLPCRPLNLSPSHQSSCPPGLRPPVQYSFQHPRLPSSSHAGVAPASRCRGIDSLRPWLLGHSWASRKRDHCRQAWFLKIDFRPIRTRAQSGFCAEHGGLYAGQSHPLLCRSRSFHLSPAPPRAGHFGENSRLPCPRGLVARSHPPSPLDRVEEILAFQPACGTSRGSIPSASILPARDWELDDIGAALVSETARKAGVAEFRVAGWFRNRRASNLRDARRLVPKTSTRYPLTTLRKLVAKFDENDDRTAEELQAIGDEVGLGVKQVRMWFNERRNRRATGRLRHPHLFLFLIVPTDDGTKTTHDGIDTTKSLGGCINVNGAISVNAVLRAASLVSLFASLPPTRVHSNTPSLPGLFDKSANAQLFNQNFKIFAKCFGDQATE